MTITRPPVDALPAPRGHYAPVAVGGGLVAVAGQLPIDRDGNPRAVVPVPELHGGLLVEVEVLAVQPTA